MPHIQRYISFENKTLDAGYSPAPLRFPMRVAVGLALRYLPDLRHTADGATPGELDNVINRRADGSERKDWLGLGDQGMEASDCFLGAVRMQGRQRPVMAGVHGPNQLERLRAASLAENQTVGPHTQCLAE